MDIVCHGFSCFRITERGHTSVVTDPYAANADFAKLRLAADLVTVSHKRARHRVEDIRDAKYVIAGPGEYEVGELFVTGIALHHHDAGTDAVSENVAYHFEYPNGLNVLHLGALSQLPDPSIFERMDQVNALLLPVDAALLGGDQLTDLISVIEPNYVAPMQPIRLRAGDFAAALEGFLKLMGVNSVEAQTSLRLTPANLPEQTQIALLEANLKTS